MSKEREQEVNTQEVKEDARTAIERGDDIRHDVRDITLKALSEGLLNINKMNQVIHAVMEGVSIGAEAKGGRVKDALTDAMAGMDDALAKSAEASKLAIEETAGHLKDFSSHDLKQALDDLLALEALFLDTVHDVAKGANDLVKETLKDSVNHAKNSGTSVGKTASETVDSLNQKLGNTLKETTSASSKAALEAGTHIANAAAGILEGIADRLKSAGKSKTDKE